MRRRLARPEPERRDRGKVLEIPVCTQHDEFVPDAEPGQESIDGADLNATAATVVAKICCGGMIFTLGHDQRQRSESIKNLLSRFRAAETLQDLLKNQACGKDRSFVPKSVSQEVHDRMTLTTIAAHGKRPDTSVNEQFQSRDRAVL
jgi:hypothetical protein